MPSQDGDESQFDIRDPRYIKVRAQKIVDQHSQEPPDPPAAVLERLAAAGKFTTRERVSRLFDEGTQESIDRAVPGVYAARGKIHGKLCYVVSWDPAVKAGTCTGDNGWVFADVIRMARESECPIITLMESGGAWVPDGISSLASYAAIFMENSRASGRIPQIAVMLGYNAGGAAYSPALMDQVVANRANAAWAVTGPKIVEATTGQRVTMEQLGGVEVHGKHSGQLCVARDTEAETLEATREIIRMLPSSCMTIASPISNGDAVDRRPSTEVLQHFVQRRQAGRVSDIRPVIGQILDRPSDGASGFLEIRPDYARNITTGLGHLGGNLVGVVANNSLSPPRRGLVTSAAITPEAGHKAAKFVQFCDAFNIPVITFVDVSGVVPDPTIEQENVLGFGAALIHAYQVATVPTFSVLVHQAFGGAWCIMSGIVTGARTYAWPDGLVAVMGAGQAVNLIHRRELESIGVVGAVQQDWYLNVLAGANWGNLHEQVHMVRVGDVLKWSNWKELQDARRKELIAEYTARELNLRRAVEEGFIDRVIDDITDTRQILAQDVAEAMERYSKSGLGFKHHLSPV